VFLTRIPMVRLRRRRPGSEFATPPGVLCPASLLHLFLSLFFLAAGGFGAPTARSALEQVSVMQ
jgi:hypothetical protein